MTHASTSLQRRVQRSLAINRTAELTFPCVFMALAVREIQDDDVIVEFADDGTFRDAAGELSWTTIGVLADRAVGAVIGIKAGPKVRGVTIHLQVQMTGASTRGRTRVLARGHFVSFSENALGRQSFATATIECDGAVVAHASAAFMMRDLPDGKTLSPRPWLAEATDPGPIEGLALDSNELEAVRRCERAEAEATEAFPFIEHFWGGIPQATDGGAHLNVPVAAHLGNRVGHAHGGLLLGIAARVANAAVPPNLRLSNISAWFISPGLGPDLEVRSSVVQQGRSIAVVRTQIVGASNKLVLEATSQHVAAAAE